MSTIRTFNSVALGESHKTKNIPCQDAALSYEDPDNGIYIAAVSDGHGSERHFMSEHGSRILVELVIEFIKRFLHESECSQLAVPFTMSEVITVKGNSLPNSNQTFTHNWNDRNRLINGLVSSIISNWNIAIEKHWTENKPTKEYMQERAVPDQSIDEYLNDINLEYAYGCTLIAYAKAPDFWLAFQIGDGTCIAFNRSGEAYHPIPGDERFSGSTTASMCNENAIESLRYCYGNTNVPVIVFLGSDGLDGVFGTMDEYSIPQLENFYGTLIKLFVKSGFEYTVREIEISLPLLSAKGYTRDDMSLAGVLDLTGINKLYPLLVKKHVEKSKKELILIDDRLNTMKVDQLNLETEAAHRREIIRNLEAELLQFEEDLIKSKLSIEKTLREKEIIMSSIKLLTSEYEEPNNSAVIIRPSKIEKQENHTNSNLGSETKPDSLSSTFSKISKSLFPGKLDQKS